MELDSKFLAFSLYNSEVGPDRRAQPTRTRTASLVIFSDD